MTTYTFFQTLSVADGAATDLKKIDGLQDSCLFRRLFIKQNAWKGTPGHVEACVKAELKKNNIIITG